MSLIRTPMFAVVAVLLSALGCAAPDVRPSRADFDELMHKSGLWIQLAQVEPMLQAGVSQQAQSARLSEQSLAQLREAITATYAAADLRTATRDRLIATLSSQDAQGVLRWLSSDLGQRITALEEAASAPDKVFSRQESGPRLLASLPAARSERIEHLVKSTLSAEAAADLAIDTMTGMAHGLAMSSTGPARDSVEDVKARLVAQQDRYIAALGPRIAADLAVMYQSLPDQELDQYIAFCESPPGRKYIAASLDAIDKALTEAAIRLGRRLASERAALRTLPGTALDHDTAAFPMRASRILAGA